jgi:hypothetical protein
MTRNGGRDGPLGEKDEGMLRASGVIPTDPACTFSD